MSRRLKTAEEKYSKLIAAKPGYYQPESTARPIPAPIGGWNTLSPLANMKPEYAVVLDNWVPRPGWVELRGGYVPWVQALGGSNVNPVNSLMVYRPAGSTERLFAAQTTVIYEVTNNGVQTVSKSGNLGTSQWQYVNFTPSGGSTYLVLCNGANPVLNFDGSTWTTPSITNISSSTFIFVHSHMRRLWFIPVNTTQVWYLPVDSISGAATLLDIGPFLTKGSYLTSMQTWTIDGASGPTALLILMSNKGQVVIYSGQDPSSNFTLVGTFDLPLPVGRRCMTKIGSDVAIITQEGLIPISKALPFNPAAIRSVAFTNAIQTSILQSMQTSMSNFGWECTLYPQQSLMILNVPISQGSLQYQYVMNTITQAWCRFTGWNANCFAIFNENLYFGDNNGNVNLAYTGRLDNLAPIFSDMQCAYNFFGEQNFGRNKYISMVKPYLIVDGIVTPTIGFNVDFQTSTLTAPVTNVTPAGAVWDTGIWDTSLWSAGQIASAKWLSSNVVGTALGLRMVVNYGASSSQQTGFGFFDIGVFDSAVFDGTGITSGSGVALPVLQVAGFESIQQDGGAI